LALSQTQYKGLGVDDEVKNTADQFVAGDEGNSHGGASLHGHQDVGQQDGADEEFPMGTLPAGSVPVDDRPEEDSIDSSGLESFSSMPDDESVHSEAQVGPTDITGEDEVYVEDEPEEAAPLKVKASKPRKTMSPAELASAEAAAQSTSEEVAAADEPPNLQWYILKVQTNREDSIRDTLKRRVAMEGLDRYFGDIIVPVEMVTEFKAGKKRVTKRKLYPGYIVVHMEINDDTWYLVRETSGIGDFTGAMGRPTPMSAQDVAKIVKKSEETLDEQPKLKINFKQGDRVKINEGTFDSFEGNVETIDQVSGRVTVMINIFGRSTPVELEYWQIETV